MSPSEQILVVDDDADFLNIITRILKKKDFIVRTAVSGAEAIVRLKESLYNATILDISLPDADGTELLSTILNQHPDIIAIMLTGHSSVQNAIKSLNCGAYAYLEKPVDPENLISVIRKGLEKQRLVLENRELVEELERHNHISSTLLNVSQAVSQTLILEDIVNAALEQVDKCTGMEASFVYLEENEKLILKGSHGLSPRVEQMIPAEVPLGSGCLNNIYYLQDNVHVMELKNATNCDLEFLLRGGYHSFAGIPLKLLGDNIGVMGVATSFANCFSPSIIELLTGIGREIAIAVQNAQLYEEASSARALRELDSMRTEFLANVSHELRTPLAVIKGSANSLLQPDVIFDEQTRRDFLISIDKDADTLTRLVDDLLMMSRLEANALEVHKKALSLYEVIDALKDRLNTITTHHHLQINILKELPKVPIDEGRIVEVMTNLVENAVKFSPDNSTIRLDARQQENDIIVSVSDEGIGIPEDLHDKIFERFFQGEGRKNGRRKGTGLGLAICRGIVEAHGGRIRVESRPGEGSSFIFNLPLE